MHVFSWFNCELVLLYYVYVLEMLGIVLNRREQTETTLYLVSKPCLIDYAAVTLTLNKGLKKK